MYSQYFETLPIERLLGLGISASDLNDDVLGRTLDEIYGADSTQLFMKLALKMMENVHITTQLLQSDTTNFSVHGDYKHIDGSSAIEITYGHAKDGRNDLNTDFRQPFMSHQKIHSSCIKTYNQYCFFKKHVFIKCSIRGTLNF